jgi:hypothetical protein
VFELVADGAVLARLGRSGSWRIFFGRGQVIELPDGTRWRLRAVGKASAICPVIVDADGRKVALASPHHGGYGLNGPDWAYVLYPTKQHRFIRSNRWILRHHEQDIGVVTRTPREIAATSPVPIGAVILSLMLTVHATPGEAELGIPAFRWGTS